MKAAFAIWEGRIAPVFDVARRVAVVDLEPASDPEPEIVALPDDLPAAKAGVLVAHKVDVLVCGAVSRSMHDVIAACGIEVRPFMGGDVAELIPAWRDGRLDQERFRLPGCGRGFGRTRRRGGGCFGRAAGPAPAGTGRGPGMGPGRGGGRRRRRRADARRPASPKTTDEL